VATFDLQATVSLKQCKIQPGYRSLIGCCKHAFDCITHVFVGAHHTNFNDNRYMSGICLQQIYLVSADIGYKVEWKFREGA